MREGLDLLKMLKKEVSIGEKTIDYLGLKKTLVYNEKKGLAMYVKDELSFLLKKGEHNLYSVKARYTIVDGKLTEV